MQEVLSKITKPIDGWQPGSDFKPEFPYETIARGLAEQAAINAETVISAAAVVLAHSRTDEAFTIACEVAIDLAPKDWYSELSADRKIKLGDLRDEGAETIFEKELSAYKKRLGAKSLPSRAALLFRKVPIKLHKDIHPAENAYYRSSKLKEADDLRHEIVHGSVLPKISIAQSRATTHFFQEAAQTAVRSLGFAFKLSVDWNYLKELAETTTKKK
jgi:hypothetical protein